MPFNPNAAYRTVTDAEGDLYISQGGRYFNEQRDDLPTIPRTRRGFAAPTGIVKFSFLVVN